MNIAVILVSGQGKRMGAGKNKVLLDLAGKPLIYWTLRNFQDCGEVDKILLVVQPEEQIIFEDIIKKESFDKVIGFCGGGKERQDSAYNGLVFLKDFFKNEPWNEIVVLFHNGANPFLENDEIERGIKAACRVGASVLAHPTKDTIKQVGADKKVEKTLDRTVLWNMQTPQIIKFELALKAFESALSEGFLGTDDVSLVERIGGAVEVVPASEYNFKVTTPLDLKIAENIIQIRQKNV